MKSVLMKKVFVIVVLSCFFSCLPIICTHAESMYNNDSADLGEFIGSGLKQDPYRISSFEDLCLLRDYVDDGRDFSSTYFIQTKDILFPQGYVWNGIGEIGSEKSVAFRGFYNGNGHYVANLNSNENYAGLFSYLGGEVWNLGIESGKIQGDYVGAIACKGEGSAKIVNCYNKATISPFLSGSGIIDDGSSLVMYCWNLGEIIKQDSMCDLDTIAACEDMNVINCYSSINENRYQDNNDSNIIDSNELDVLINDYYDKLWDDYSLYISYQYSVTINRANIVFLVVKDGSIYYDSSYEPQIFANEKNENRQHFLSVYPRRYSFKGNGTQDDPFLIFSYEDLCLFRDCVNIGIFYDDYYFMLMNDIVFPDESNWIPIGFKQNIYSRGFSGIFDGNGHTLSNIHCSYIGGTAGLFSYLEGVVFNLGIESGIFEDYYAGSICSSVLGTGKIYNCYSEATVKSAYYTGGICAINNGQVFGCSNGGEIIRLSEESAFGSICAFGTGTLNYCVSLTDDQIVDTKEYSGDVMNSGYISASEFTDQLEEKYIFFFK